ncbi:TPA: HNH endonuclease [Morganella morganii]|nr:HNH endonuclease [Morganella morganii]
MNRKQFIMSHGASCNNWTWSWSFINHDKKMVIFGAWDVEREQERAVILRESWEYNTNNKKQPGYTQAIEHIRFLNEGYKLYTFNMVFAEHPENPNIAVIDDFERKLNKRYLRKEGSIWYADFLPNSYPDEIPSSDSYIEGAKKQVTINAYERDPKARQACIAYHGTACKCCGFDFELVYGEHGKGFIHIHHIRPLYMIGEDYKVDPVTDLIPLCPNCHAMIHRGSNVLLVDELKSILISNEIKINL